MAGNTVLVVADDLTGANATAAGFARAGLRAVTVGADQGPDVVAEFASRFDAVVASTDSRHEPPERAAALVTSVIRAGWPARLVSNRIDSTLRGNVGASTAAALRAVAEESGRRAVALCAPAHPDAGRHTVEGTQLLDGVRLEHTELAHDPRTPVRHSAIEAIIAEQADLRVAHLPLSVVTNNDHQLAEALTGAVADGADVVVADAITTAHLRRIAHAAAAVEADEMIWVSVDSGPASVALATAFGVTGDSAGAPLLAVSGSATRLTRTQLATLRADRAVTVVKAAPAGNAGSVVPDVDATAHALDAALAAAGPGDVVIVATVLEDGDVADISADDATLVPVALARAVRRVLEQRTIDGLFSTGGDVTAALFTELGAHGLDVELEVEPLAVAGTFVGGPWAGLPVATKGGLIGSTTTIAACLDHLRQAATTTRRHVRAAQSRLSFTTPLRRTP
ncbi:four-carbon acid sugar kinase family protein [Phytoactinopolyspora limicola]|uniref:four-carbon acid sugar kinase family protein n=1 Tax=Phytoactinopolyspora limicola TaxID=2715536 RepID=UPI001A9C8BD8|nr:four-carbon acid sugar kinase family protein [Phytoactinopolyspora limicola]